MAKKVINFNEAERNAKKEILRMKRNNLRTNIMESTRKL